MHWKQQVVVLSVHWFLYVCVVVGFLFDITGNYDIPFVVCGSIQTVGGLCGVCVFVMKRCRRQAKHP